MLPTERDARLRQNAGELRARQTQAESLLWAVLRGRGLCSLKFRRQHSILPFIADSACVEQKLVVKLDGGYHDYVQTEGAGWQRQWKLEAAGWSVIGFSNADVLSNVEALAKAIAGFLKLNPEFGDRQNV